MPLRLVPDRPLDDWDRLLHSVPQMGWVRSVSRTEGPHPWDRPLPDWAPGLTRLLSAAQVTPVTIEGLEYEILGWQRRAGGRTGWLCPPPPPRHLEVPAYERHAELLSSLGGVAELWQQPSSWLSGAFESLMPPLDRHSADFIYDYEWMWEEDGLTLPIDPSEWYSISDGPEGNSTLCHRTQGDVLRWAPDTDGYSLRLLEDCPEGTLYRIDGTPDFCLWVEQLALQWLTEVIG